MVLNALALELALDHRAPVHNHPLFIPDLDSIPVELVIDKSTLELDPSIIVVL